MFEIIVKIFIKTICYIQLNSVCMYVVSVNKYVLHVERELCTLWKLAPTPARGLSPVQQERLSLPRHISYHNHFDAPGTCDIGRMSAGNGTSRTALILYGSETGNAQEIAEELGRTAERLHFVTHVGECNGVKAVSVISSVFRCGLPILTALSGLTSLIFTCHIRGINYWPRRLPGQWASVLEDALVEKTAGNISQRCSIYAIRAR